MNFLSRNLTLPAFAFLIISLGGVQVGATELERVATVTGAGEWRQLSTQGFDGDLLIWEGRHAFQYADGMAWDPVLGELHFVGAGHQAETRHLVYSDSDNRWSRREMPGIGFTHGYDHLSIDAAGRRLFMRKMGDKALYVLRLGTTVWTKSASAPVSNIQVATGVQWFPELGKLVQVDQYNGILFYDPAGNSWSSSSVSLSGLGAYHNIAEYSDVHRVVIVGGGNGSRVLYRIDANGTVDRMRDAPVELGIQKSVVTVDPVGGNFLVVSSDGSFYEYDPLGDTWSEMPVSVPPVLMGRAGDGEWGLVAAPVSTYGVVVFARSSYSGGEAVYVYRHEPGVGKPVRPKVPKAPSELDTLN